MKKKIIIAYPAMMIGGSTTSLLSVLNMLDYNKYDVDLLLSTHTGELMDQIPEKVNLLEPLNPYKTIKEEHIHRLLSPKYMYHYAISKFIQKKSNIPMHAAQYLEMKDVLPHREINEEYDVAIAFLEGAQCKFVANHIKAKRKIAWVHINYADSEFDPKYDRDSMKEFDRIVLVSDDCKKAFDSVFPELKGRSLVVENILSSEFVRNMAKSDCDLKIDENKINLVSSCRINFKPKGLDRAVDAMSKLKKENKLDNIVWYILGDGIDRQALENMIAENNLSDNIVLLGMKKNPYKYLKLMTMFFLPSRWEGKPMAVTEAFMMGLPVLVTEYSSAKEQINNGVDGIIVENSTEGIYEGLKALCENKIDIDALKNNILSKDYSNVEEIKRVEELIEGRL